MTPTAFDEAGNDRLIFRAGSKRLALPASAVREIACVPSLTRVPLAPPQLLGLGIVRGETLAILSTDASNPRQLLVLDGAQRAALAVDRVERLQAGGAKAEMFALDALLEAALPIRAKAISRDGARGGGSGVGTAPGAEDARLALLRFAVGDQSFALPLEKAEEVLRLPEAIARMPRGAPAVIGTIALRDTALALFSLAALLALPEGRHDMRQRIVVTRTGGHRLGLLVDRVEGLLHIPASRIDPVPAALARGAGEARIAAICRPQAGGRLVSVLAADQLLNEVQTRQLHARKEARQTAPARAGSEPLRILPVRLGAYQLGFRLASIERVLARPARATRVPGAPAWLTGIASIGGEPLAVVDQVLRLTGRPAEGPGQRLLVIRADGARLGFLVDRVDGIVQAGPEDLASAPLPEALAAGVYGEVLEHVGEALLLLEPKALFSAAERDLAAAHVHAAR